MINKTVKHYEVKEKIGAGGMGVVYKAYDSKLDREVALKFLPSSLSSSEHRKKRLLNEARAASALDHHNTCVIHEIDETDDGQLYIVMPVYEGQPLDVLIQQRKLRIKEAVDIAIQIAEGLKAAHGRNIIHRDIKSGNIIVNDAGHAVIMDFGLARKDGMTRLTQSGQTMGTVHYMSPEQALGEEVDQRSDIWSLGVVLYEMLAGRVPYQNEYPQAVIYSILNEEPEDLSLFNSDIPPELANVVKKALAKDKEERYQQADEILNDLLEIKSQISASEVTTGLPGKTTGKKNIVTSYLSLSLVLVVITAIIGYYLYSEPQEIAFHERDWIMLADFKNETGEEVFNQFLRGVLEISLQQSTYINLYGSSSIQQILYNEMEKKDVLSLTPDIVEEAATFKDVKVMLIPGINKNGESYLLTADIRDLSSKNEIRVGPVEAADQKSVLQAIDELAHNIRLKLGEPPSQIYNGNTPVAKATTSSLEALKLYVEGKRLKGIDKSSGLELIEQSVQIDPEFALAHAELGMSYYIDGNSQKGEAHFKQALEQMSRLTTRERLWIQAVVEDWRGNRSKAIEKYRAYLSRYPDDYSAWWRLGYTYLITGNENQCINSFSRVIEIEPREASALVNLATCYNGSGDADQALEYYEMAFELRPDFKKGIYVNNEYGFLLAKMEKIEEAQNTFELMLSHDNTKARGLRNLALLNMYQGKCSIAIEQLNEAVRLNQSQKKTLSEFRDRMYLARIYLFKGMKQAFNEELDEVERLMEEMRLAPSWLSDVGKIYARTGQIEKASQTLNDIESRIEDPLTVSGVSRNFTEDHAHYYKLKGEIELANRNDENAIESLEVANNISDYHLESLAYGYYVVGNLKKAIDTYQKIIENKKLGREYQQDWILAHYRLGTIYQQLGNTENATKFFNAFTDIWKDGDQDIVFLEDAKQRLKSINERTE